MFLRVVHIINILLFVINVSRCLDWRVFNGQELHYDDHSYLVKLDIYTYRFIYLGSCSGSVVSYSWILTSAHCIQPKLHNIKVIHENEYEIINIAKVKRRDVYKHPYFKMEVDTMRNREKDIALLHLRKEIQFKRLINPIRLSEIRPKIGDTGIILGFGDTEDNITSPREGIVLIDSCPEDNETMNICSIGSVRAGPGDSGGPLIYKGKLAGITSGGCTDYITNNMCVTLFTSVEIHFEWILQVVSSVVNKENP